MNCPCGKDLAQHITDGWTCEELNAEIARAQGLDVRHPENVLPGIFFRYDEDGDPVERLQSLTNPVRLMELLKWVGGVIKRPNGLWYTPYIKAMFENPQGRALRDVDLYYFNTTDAIIMAATMIALGIKENEG